MKLRLHCIALLAAALPGCVPVYAADHKAPPAKAATEYPAVDDHATEHVAVAIDPCSPKEKCDFFRLDYLENEILPVRVIITNNSNNPVTLEEARMQYITADGDKVPAAIEEEVNRRLFTFKNAKGTKIPLPGPLPPITVHHPVDKKITQDFNDFGFQTTTIMPHSTVAGYLFYDVQGVKDATRTGEIYIKQIKTRIQQDGTTQELFAFSIPLRKTPTTWVAPAKK